MLHLLYTRQHEKGGGLIIRHGRIIRILRYCHSLHGARCASAGPRHASNDDLQLLGLVLAKLGVVPECIKPLHMENHHKTSSFASGFQVHPVCLQNGFYFLSPKGRIPTPQKHAGLDYLPLLGL